MKHIAQRQPSNCISNNNRMTLFRLVEFDNSSFRGIDALNHGMRVILYEFDA